MHSASGEFRLGAAGWRRCDPDTSGSPPNVGDVHYRGPGSGVLDPLLAKVIVFRQG